MTMMIRRRQRRSLMSSTRTENRRRKTDTIATVVSCAAGIAAIVALGFSYSSHKDDVDKITTQARIASYDNRLTARTECSSANDSRVDNIRFILDLAAEEQLLLIPASGSTNTTPEQKAEAKAAQKVLLSYVVRFKDSALQIAQSVPANEAVHPHSTDPELRALRDCMRLYPLPANRGDPLPDAPTF
jgi:hypothetical protein